jgi:topoisomerase-4 subunit A
MSELVDTAPTEDDPSLAELGLFAERAYLDYAVSVVKGRALPDVCDGQKPVQRRLLYAMNEMGLGPSAKPVKSARVVGDVLGKYHPHGDVAAYDALVRMAQSFTLRYPLIDGQGNFGSRDGDSAAAMRYTEARLTPIARVLLDEIDQETVDFIPNYDGAFKEPKVLPARLPMVLLNGASGIAVGMATEVVSHNLREVAAAAVAVLREFKTMESGSEVQREALLQEVLKLLPGPDFPGGGQIVSPASAIHEVYRTGRGSIRMRARYSIEELARGQWQLVVHELPQGVSSQTVLQDIEDITNPKIKLGKKALSAEQLQAKQAMLALLDAVRDESGKEAAVRLVFEPKTSKVDQGQFVQHLLASTSLQSSVPVNFVMVGGDGRPRQMTLLEILHDWAQFRLHTVTRRSQFRLRKVDARIHVLEGREQILANIDEVIALIRASDDPKQALIERFSLSEIQADDILEIRLRQLARLEAIRIGEELKALRQERGELVDLLEQPATLRRKVIREVEQDAKTYGDARRTLIEEAQTVSAEAVVLDEPVTVIVSEKGWVRSRQGHGHDASQFSFKTGDRFDGAYEVRTTDTLCIVSSTGRVYSVGVHQLPSARGDGQPLSSFIELEPGARALYAFAAPASAQVLLASKKGLGLACRMEDLLARNRAGRSFFSLEAQDEPVRPALFGVEHTQVLCVSTEGKALCFGVEDIKVLRNGGKGVILMGLEDKDTLAQAIAFVAKKNGGSDGVMVRGIGRGAKPIERHFSAASLTDYASSRARKGKFLEPRIRNAHLSLPTSPST